MKRIQIITGAAALLAALTACTSPKQGQPTPTPPRPKS